MRRLTLFPKIDLTSNRNILVVTLAFAVLALIANQFRGRTNRMLTPESAFIAGDSTEDVFQSCNEIGPRLTPDARDAFTDIRLEYLAAFGMDDACDKMRGKTVRQIIDEYVPTKVEPRESGEVDGIQFSIYSAPGSAGVEPSIDGDSSREPSVAPNDRASRIEDENSKTQPPVLGDR